MGYHTIHVFPVQACWSAAVPAQPAPTLLAATLVILFSARIA